MSEEEARPVVYKFDTDTNEAEEEADSYTSQTIPCISQNGQKVVKSKTCYMIVGVIIVAAIISIIIGIVLLIQCYPSLRRDKSSNVENSDYIIRDMDDYCRMSKEASRVGLNSFLLKCQKFYFKNHRHEELLYNEDSHQDIKNQIAVSYKPFLPTPRNLKEYADGAEELKKQLKDIKYDEEMMKPKENQILSEISLLLDQSMSNNFEENYYEGGWMFPPNYFCHHRICSLKNEINTITYNFRPRTVEDVLSLTKTFFAYNKTIEQYITNLKLGIASGMVRSKSSCEAGTKAFREEYRDIIINGPFEGLKASWFTNNILSSAFYKEILNETNFLWKKRYQERIVISLFRALMHGFSKPIIKYYNFLVNEYTKQCPPDNVASGLSSLPLSYQYLNGNADFSKQTTKKLPETDNVLNGKELYRKILPRFTTIDMTPDEVFEEGNKQLDQFFSKMVEAAKEYTKIRNESDALKELRKRINESDQWHGALKFPEVESNETAFERCVDDKSAKKYCPVRWRSMEKWKNYLNRVLSMIHPLLSEYFYFTGPKKSVPSCPITIQANYNPLIATMSYHHSDNKCSAPTVFGLPFFLDRYGPKFQEWSITGHEARPGHNFQHQGSIELFSSQCPNRLLNFFHNKGLFTGFIEGWALYAENPILSDDVRLYKGNTLQKIGMYKWQVVRAARLVIDVGIHYKGKNRDWALNLLKKYALESTEVAAKEITRYMSTPGQAAVYMIGRLEILKARVRLESKLNHHLDLKDFHYRILSLGQIPLSYLPKYIDRYIKCLDEPKRPFCMYFNIPVNSIPRKAPGNNVENQSEKGNTEQPQKQYYL